MVVKSPIDWLRSLRLVPSRLRRMLKCPRSRRSLTTRPGPKSEWLKRRITTKLGVFLRGKSLPAVGTTWKCYSVASQKVLPGSGAEPDRPGLAVTQSRGLLVPRQNTCRRTTSAGVWRSGYRIVGKASKHRQIFVRKSS